MLSAEETRRGARGQVAVVTWRMCSQLGRLEHMKPQHAIGIPPMTRSS